MQLKNIDFVTRVLFDVLPRHLGPYVRASLEQAGMQDRWEPVFQAHDRRNGRSPRRYDLSDPVVQLKLLFVTTDRRPLIDVPRPAQDRARQLVAVRNRYAHPSSGGVSDDDVLEAIVQTRGLFEELGRDDAVVEIADLRAAFLDRRRVSAGHATVRASGIEPAPAPGPAAAPAPAGVPVPADVSPTAGDPAPASDLEPAPAHVLDSLDVRVEGAPSLTSYAHAYNQPMITIEVHLSGAVEEVPALRVTPSLVLGEQALTSPGDRVVAIGRGESTVAEVRLVLDRAAMLDIGVGAVARFRVDLSAGDRTRTVWSETEIDVLGANSWYLRDGGDLQGLRYLASFVRPSQPEIPRLAKSAAAVLGERTRSDALNAYQQDADRTDQIVDALARSIHARRLTYANPPAGWEGMAQRIRTAGEILDESLATCLDLTVLLAGVLEETGIDAQLWIAQGHIFLGYWRRDEAGTGQSVMEPALAANAVDAGQVRLVETTLLASEPIYPGLEAMHTTVAGTYLGERQDELVAVIEIKAARHARILPLPVRAVTAQGEVQEIEYHAAERDLRSLVDEQLPDDARTAHRDRDVPDRVTRWKNELLDLTLRNRLINLTPRAASEIAVPEKILGTFENMLHAHATFDLIPGEELRAVQSQRGVPFGTETEPPRLAEDLAEGHRLTIDLSEDAYGRHLMRLASNARTVVQETGANNLYLALGTLRWQTSASGGWGKERKASAVKHLVSPLVLVPVTLTQRNRAQGSRYRIRLDDTGASTPNHSLLERLRHDLGIEIPGLADPADDGAGIDLDAAFDAVRRAIAQHELPFRVEPTVHLGMFNFAGFRLWKDLEDDWRSLLRNPLVEHLVHTPGEIFADPAAAVTSERDLDEMVASLPTPSDASQTEVVSQAVAGRTIMVQGPPGTGKSQTITNLIVQAMVEGKRVLFVAEKQAALEVVSRRLEAAGIGDLVLNLHDHGQSVTAVKKALNRAIDAEADADEVLLGVRSRSLRSVRSSLIDYRRAVHQPNAIGRSLYASRTIELALASDIPALPIPPAFLRQGSREQRDEIEASLGAVVAAAHTVDRRPDHPWRALGPDVPRDAVGRVAEQALALHRLMQRLHGSATALARTARRPEHLRNVADALRQPWLTWQLLEHISTPQWLQATDQLIRLLQELWDTRVDAFAIYRTSVLDGPLDQVRSQLTEAREAMFGKKRKTRRAMAPLAPWELAGQAFDPEHADAILGELLHVREQVRDAGTQLHNNPAFHHWGAVDLLDPRARQRILEHANWLRARALPPDPQPWKPKTFRRVAAELFAQRDQGRSLPHLPELLAQIAELWHGLETAMGRELAAPHAGSPGTGGQAARDTVVDGPDGPGPLGGLLDSLSYGTSQELSAHGLHQFNALEHSLGILRRAGLDATAEAILDGTVPPEQIDLAFEKGMAIASRRERETDPLLAGFDGASHDAQIAHFEDLSSQLRTEVSRAAASRIIEHRSRGEEGVSPQEVGKLRRDIGGRSLPKIRTLFTKYGPAITRMMPCVLVSPDSAARFIPSGMQLFDLVVFDEASQITPANAVGAMGRGRTVVVVGDSKQMPPTRFAQLTRDVAELDQEGDEEDAVSDEESVLEECRRAGVPSHNLTWHYRSQSEALIAFSNTQYYDGQLASFPSPVAVEADPGPDGYGVSMVRVDGQFHRPGEGAARKLLRTNPIEAHAIVEEIRERYRLARERQDEEPSIGVITFNVQQRDLIETLLRESGDEGIAEALDAPEGIFVKNLENVQGDERDTILFSLAFSPTVANAGGDVPLNFGPLNRQGGERRLNVAVTRARRQVVVFCSFEPEQLKAERSSSLGLQHLRSYLELARHGTRSLRTTSGEDAVSDRHRDDIAHALVERGFAVEKALGLSGFRIDLAIADPDDAERLLVAVLLDNKPWAQRGTEYDRDVLPRAVLTGSAGWPGVHRVWLPDWIHRRDQVLERLEAAVEEAKASQEAKATQQVPVSQDADVAVILQSAEDGGTAHESEGATSPQDSDEPEGLRRHERCGPPQDRAHLATSKSEDKPQVPQGSFTAPAVPEPVMSGSLAARTAAPDEETTAAVERMRGRRASSEAARGALEFRPWEPTQSYDQARLNALGTRSARRQVTELAEEIVTVEHPIFWERLCGHIVRAHGLGRVFTARAQAVWAAIDKNRLVVDRDGFVWPAGSDPDAHDGFRRNALTHDGVRIDDLHPREVRNAVAAEHRRNAFADPEHIQRAALNALGGTKMTKKARPVLERAYREVVGSSHRGDRGPGGGAETL
ncbi:MAG TPA: DUF4011 domain-containing protein [Jiangellaceae bacterium]|nr:DUF4011 domain-containing protein [Jiangellaceae bacterium]